MTSPIEDKDRTLTLPDGLELHGGWLRCETCYRTESLGDVRANLSVGWPRCCGYTMRWWTQRQIDAGEVPW